jgi:hypothetical protein
VSRSADVMDNEDEGEIWPPELNANDAKKAWEKHLRNQQLNKKNIVIKSKIADKFNQSVDITS